MLIKKEAISKSLCNKSYILQINGCATYIKLGALNVPLQCYIDKHSVLVNIFAHFQVHNQGPIEPG